MIPLAGSNGTGRPDGSQIAQFRELITQNPELRQHFIQQLSQENPELGQLLTQNPDLLLQFLDSIGEDGNNAAAGRQTVRLAVTEAEHGAIARVSFLPFSDSLPSSYQTS